MSVGPHCITQSQDWSNSPHQLLKYEKRWMKKMMIRQLRASEISRKIYRITSKDSARALYPRKPNLSSFHEGWKLPLGVNEGRQNFEGIKFEWKIKKAFSISCEFLINK